jgi:uncharacterized SAM-binding protein YcdF (DUF218 family)
VRQSGLNESCDLKRIIYKTIMGLFAAAIFVWVVEFVCFYFLLQKVPVNEPADVVVVFGGAHARTVKGYALANEGLAPFMIVSPASEKQLKHLDKTYRLRDQYHYLIEDRAETTFQNAMLACECILQHGLKSVLLVTSDYHIPRSFLLLRLQLIGSGVTVRTVPVESSTFGRNPLAWSGLQKKRVYNEMVQLWGSLMEMAHYCVTGQLPHMGLKHHMVVAWLRSVLLFDTINR